MANFGNVEQVCLLPKMAIIKLANFRNFWGLPKLATLRLPVLAILTSSQSSQFWQFPEVPVLANSVRGQLILAACFI